MFEAVGEGRVPPGARRGGRGDVGAGPRGTGRDQRADLGFEDPRAPRCHSLGPPEDRRTFSIIYVTTGQSQFPALHAGDFSQTLSQPEPSLWSAWRAAMSFGSYSLGVVASGPKMGSPRVPPSPDFALGAKVGARRGVGGAHSRGYPQCLPEVSKIGVGNWTLRAG